MAIRKMYEEMGVDGYYINNADTYSNPHLSSIIRLLEIAENEGLINGRILDLCCGTGEVTKNIRSQDIIGLDPYMHRRYELETGKRCYPFSFKDISRGKINEFFGTIICSFALHLCPESLLPSVLWNLGLCSSVLIIISPNKKPDCDGISNWVLINEHMIDRTRMKIYIK